VPSLLAPSSLAPWSGRLLPALVWRAEGAGVYPARGPAGACVKEAEEAHQGEL